MLFITSCWENISELCIAGDSRFFLPSFIIKAAHLYNFDERLCVCVTGGRRGVGGGGRRVGLQKQKTVAMFMALRALAAV